MYRNDKKMKLFTPHRTYQTSQTIKLNVHYFLTPPYPQNYFHFLHSDHPQHDENHVQGAGRLNTERSWTHNEGSFPVTGISNIVMMKRRVLVYLSCSMPMSLKLIMMMSWTYELDPIQIMSLILIL